MLNFKLRPVIELINEKYKFFVPAYQRGYKWTRLEVLKLMMDIWDFKIYRGDNNKDAFYCLQPIVVRHINDEYHVIDGQQRLTTLLIIQQAVRNSLASQLLGTPTATPICNDTYSINYETRDNSDVWLPVIADASQMQDNSDYYHIHEAYEAAMNFLKWIDTAHPDYKLKFELDEMKCPNKESEAANAFSQTMKDKCNVIWYELDDSEDEDEEKFDSLNTGKIPLTNAELIKALFLQKSNYPYDEDNKVQSDDYRTSIAREWDSFEHQLQDPSFWHFIYDKCTVGFQYETRIEYIFDLLSGKTVKDSDNYYYTFNHFDAIYQAEKQSNKDNMIPFVRTQWGRVKGLLQTLHDWYDNKEYYHYIGYLISQGHTVNEIMQLQFPVDKDGKELQIPTKRKFISNLKDIIRNKITEFKISDLFKSQKGLTPTLLLFNILIDQSSPNDNARFPFHHYKQMVWNEEHVAPNTPFEPNKPARCFQFAAQMLEYYTGISYYAELENQENNELEKPKDKRAKKAELEKRASTRVGELLVKAIDNINNDELKSTCNNLFEIFTAQGKNKEELSKDCYTKICNSFETSKNRLEPGDERDFIWNQTLLDEGTNKSYGNAIFPYKRMRVIKDDSKGIYVPLGTKNVFVKAYSHSLNNMFEWDKDDAILYLSEIFKTLKRSGFFDEDWLKESNIPEFVDVNKLKRLMGYEQEQQ